MKPKKVVMGASALAIAVGTMTVLEVGPAFAKGKVNGTGQLSCNGVKGAITFVPPLTTAGGASSETVKIKVTVSGCTGGTPNPAKGTATGTISTNSNSCTALASPSPTQTETITTKWAPSTLLPSVSTFGPDTPITSPNVGFSISKGVTTGSFAGTGATSTVLTSLSTAQLTSACSSKSGLKKLAITGGSLSAGS